MDMGNISKTDGYHMVALMCAIAMTGFVIASVTGCGGNVIVDPIHDADAGESSCADAKDHLVAMKCNDLLLVSGPVGIDAGSADWLDYCRNYEQDKLFGPIDKACIVSQDNCAGAKACLNK